MAADEAISELAGQLSVEETPVKLRCATCSQIAFNALRLPCCEQNICETCYNELEDMCQVCHHEPLDKSLCTPNKALRTTTKVFLKKKLLERAKDQKKKENDGVKPPGPKAGDEIGNQDNKQGSTTILETKTSISQGPPAFDSVAPLPPTPATIRPFASPKQGSHESQMDVPQPSIEAGSENNIPSEIPRTSSNQHDNRNEFPATAGSDQTSRQGGNAQNGQWNAPGMQDMMNGTAGFNGMSGMGGINGQFPMDLNAMMPMGGLTNMMGMGMDPMMMNQMSQSIFGGFGGQNMGMSGMNGMNMGMGLNDQGQFGGPWMAGLDTFNSNSHGNVNFGGQGGYNLPTHQGNFNQMNHQQYAHNDFQNGYGRQNYQSRGGRGRRGGFQNGSHGRHFQGHPYQGNHNGHANHDISNHAPNSQNPQIIAKPGSVNGDQEKELREFDSTQQTIEHETKALALEEKKYGDIAQNPSDPVPPGVHNGDPENKDIESNHSASVIVESSNLTSNKENQEENKPLPIQTFISDEPRSGRSMPPPRANVPLGPSAQYPVPRGAYRGAGHANSDFAQPNTALMNIPVVPPAEPKGVGVAGAPTGPRALRIGLPNTGRSGIALASRLSAMTSVAAEADPNRKKSPNADRNRPQSRPRSKSRSLSKSPSRSPPRSRSRHKSERNQSRRERSRSGSSGNGNERREDRVEEPDHGEEPDRNKEPDRGKEPDRKRSRRYDSEEEREEEVTKRSSHRSHQSHPKEPDSASRRRYRDHSHDRDHEKGRDYDDDQENDHEEDRERDKEKDRERERDRDRDKDRDRDRERDRDRHRDRGERRRRHRRSRSRASGSVDQTVKPGRGLEMNSKDEGSKKRSDRDRDETDDYSREHDSERHGRKRSRKDRHSRHHASSRDIPKPAPPVTPMFPSSRRTSATTNTLPPPPGPSAKTVPTGPRADAVKLKDRDGFRIHGRDRERLLKKESSSASNNGPRPAEKDPHTLEREARDRERLLKEMQRRATVDGPKRKSSGPGPPPGPGGARRSSVKYEDEDGAEASRVEREREGQRWR